MNNVELKKIIGQIEGLTLDNISLACEMMMFSFGNYALHTQCLTRIIKDNDILVTTHDYQSWDGETDTNNDEWYNLERFKPVIENGRVLSVEVNQLFDLEITLDNGITIQALIENSSPHYGDENEQYRFFEVEPDDVEDEDENHNSHYVVYSKYIEMQ